MNKEKLYTKAIRKWGVRAQVDVAVEECAELIHILQKTKRATVGFGTDRVLEEMADVEIMLEQLKFIYNYDFQMKIPTSKFHAIKNMKLKRLEKMLE